MNLRDKVIKLAHEKPELREHLLPLIKEGAPLPNEGNKGVNRQEVDRRMEWYNPDYRGMSKAEKEEWIKNWLNEIPSLRKIKQDMLVVGTRKYKGLAYFWNHAYRHSMRDLKPNMAKKVHDAFMKAGLKLSGKSSKHQKIMDSIVGDSALKARGWKAAHEKTAAGIDFYDQWQLIQRKNNQRLHKEYTQLLKKVSKVMTQAGLKLDMSRSSVGSYNKGSDGRVMEGLLVFKDLAFDEVFLSRDEVRDWFEKHLDMYPQLTEKSQGTWEADITAN